MKIDCKCGKVFEINKVHNHGGRKTCDECRALNKKRHSKAWRQKNKEYHKAYLINWRAECRELEKRFK